MQLGGRHVNRHGTCVVITHAWITNMGFSTLLFHRCARAHTNAFGWPTHVWAALVWDWNWPLGGVPVPLLEGEHGWPLEWDLGMGERHIISSRAHLDGGFLGPSFPLLTSLTKCVLLLPCRQACSELYVLI